MSWNILSASLATPKRLPWVLPDALSWAQRGPALCAELRAVAADIVALQEVEAAR
jgi:mRNA deadenylase 3'-5' endonuclease subunit Ccr4